MVLNKKNKKQREMEEQGLFRKKQSGPREVSNKTSSFLNGGTTAVFGAPVTRGHAEKNGLLFEHELGPPDLRG